MTFEQFDSLFEEYITRIILTKSQANSIDVMLEETLSLFASEYEGDVEMYAQGSYAMGTTVRPLTANQSRDNVAGEYDVDIVLERATWDTAPDSLNNVRNVLSSEYADKLDKKLHDSCERVLHSTDANTEVAFHVDYVPIKPISDRRHVAHRHKGWLPSDTKQLVEWFLDLSAEPENTFLPSMILIIKRMRDYAGLTDILSSICITALVCNNYNNTGTYAGDLLWILKEAIATFNVAHDDLSIRIEPLEDDLANKIDASMQAKILAFLVKSYEDLSKGFEEADTTKLRDVLSGAFPSNIDEFPDELEPLRRRGWGIETDGSLKEVDIAEIRQHGRMVSRNMQKFFGKGEQLEFHATPYEKSEYGIRWQVLNARGSKDVRGNLFPAKTAGGHKNSNEFVNHETESYDGVHWIKYFIYSKMTKRVVEIGKRYTVAVELDD